METRYEYFTMSREWWDFSYCAIYDLNVPVIIIEKSLKLHVEVADNLF